MAGDPQGKLFITQGYCHIVEDGLAERIYVDGKRLGSTISDQLSIPWKKRGGQRSLDLGEVRIWIERIPEGKQ
jgi:hypothetical protein